MKASQLIENVTTNVAESWMHVRSKFDGGKVINRSQSGSWENRCMGAGLQHNIGKKFGPITWKKMTNASPNKIYTDTAERSAKELRRQNERKADETVKAKRRRSKYSNSDNSVTARKAYSRHDGGVLPDQVYDDLSPDELEQKKTRWYETKVVVTPEEARYIERQTVDQADSDKWKTERRRRITASNAGSIAKMRVTTKKGKKVEQLLHSKFKGNTATRYGADMEEKACKQYKTYMTQTGHPNLTTEACGLFVSLLNPWLAGTPDGLVNDPSNTSQPLGLVEIKNPYAAQNKTLTEAVKTPAFCLEHKDGLFRLKRRHNYYYQVQCQLYCTNRDWCDFVVRTDKDLHVERIPRDSSWWNSQLPKLKKFYFSSLLPELAEPRRDKGGIREPV